MAEPASTTATPTDQQANSPARQLLAALTRASQDMERSVNDACEHVGKLNNELERYVSGQLESADEQIELIVRTKLEKVSSEKEAVLAQLMELRQEELQVLQQTGKKLRDALSEKLNELVNKFSSEIDDNLKKFQADLESTEKSIADGVEKSRKEFRDRMPGQLESIREEVGKEKTGLADLHKQYDEQLSQGSLVSLEELVEHCAELKAKLQKGGEDYLGAVDENVNALTAEQTERLNKRIEAFSSMQKNVKERIDALSEADLNYVKELPDAFKASAKEMADLHIGLHATTVRNLSLQYRTEILSAAQQAEDQLQIVKADLQGLLRSYQNQYSEQFESLFAKFEKSATDLSQEEVIAPDQSRDSEIMNKLKEQFTTLKKSLGEESKSGVSEIETHMEKSYEKFRVLLDAARKEATEKVEKSFHDYQGEFSKLQHSNDEQVTELSKKLEELEQSVAEARELISALDEASLDF